MEEVKEKAVLEYVLGLYFHVEHNLGIDDVKRYLSNPNVLGRSQLFKKELASSILNSQINPQKFEKLTAEEFETQAKVDEFLINEIWKPLYGDEPIKA